MKRLFLLVVALVLFAGAVFAGPSKEEIANATTLSYSKLHSVQYISLNATTKALTPRDVVSTNTYSVGYFPANTPIPCKMVITGATTTQVIYAKPYSTSTALGVDVPTATCAYIPWDSNRQITKYFTGTPNLSFTPSAAATVTIEIWVQP